MVNWEAGTVCRAVLGIVGKSASGVKMLCDNQKPESGERCRTDGIGVREYLCITRYMDIKKSLASPE